jgi:type I restriction enzyme S subunit
MKAWQGSLSISSIRGIVSPAYYVYTRESGSISDGYIHNLLRCMPYVLSYSLISKGVRVGQWDLQPELFRKTPVLVPPIQEQVKIATYLDKETSQIDTLISKKEQLIEKLLERRQALITQVVTKGLDPNVPMKDSGVEWLGKIPVGWEIKRLKHVSALITGSSLNDRQKEDYSTFHEGSTPYVSSKDLIGESRKLNPNPDFFIPAGTPGFPKAMAGDVLMVIEGGSAGKKLAVVKEEVAYGNKLCRFSFNVVYSRLQFYFLQSSSFIQQFELLTNGLIGGVSRTSLAGIYLPVPPDDVVLRLGNYLDEETNQIDTLVEKSRKAIELLKERRQALITQVVTGKIDVRGFVGGNS